MDLQQLLAMLQGGALNQLPSQPQGVRPGFGMAGASVQPSDLMDALRNADRKEGAMPLGVASATPIREAIRGLDSMSKLNAGRGIAGNLRDRLQWANSLTGPERESEMQLIKHHIGQYGAQEKWPTDTVNRLLGYIE